MSEGEHVHMGEGDRKREIMSSQSVARTYTYSVFLLSRPIHFNSLLSTIIHYE